MNRTALRMSYLFLCAVPFIDVGVAGVRALRIPGVYQSIGGVLFAAVVISAWILGARVIGSGGNRRRRLALAGALLVAPWALVSLLWVGLGPPWTATPTENRMRYLVLLAGALAVAGAFVILKEELSDADERVYSTVGFAASLPAGAAYVVWMSIQVGFYVLTVRDGQRSPSIVALRDVFHILLDVGCALTYTATAAFAASCGRVRWLGRGAARAYVIANLAAFVLLAIRGLSFPDPTASSTPWYLSPGFIVGIPAIPWIMPCLLGVVLLRRAGDESR